MDRIHEYSITLMRQNMKKRIRYSLLSGLLLVSMCALTGCGGKNLQSSQVDATQNSSQTQLASESQTETTTEETTTASTQDTSETSDGRIMGNGNYTYDNSNGVLNITFTATGSPDLTTYYDSFNWVCTVPDGYTSNKYSSSLVCFYDSERGVLFNALGSAAGSSYYTIYATSDGGKTWTTWDQRFQKTNTSEKLFFTDRDTLVLFDSGIGLASPTLDTFSITDDTITALLSRAPIQGLDEMLKSFSITEITDSTHFACDYETEDNKETRTIVIDIDPGNYPTE